MPKFIVHYSDSPSSIKMREVVIEATSDRDAYSKAEADRGTDSEMVVRVLPVTDGGGGLMADPRYTVKYARVGRGRSITHQVYYGPTALADASEARDRWLSGNGWGGWPEGELRVWVEDKNGHVVYGQ